MKNLYGVIMTSLVLLSVTYSLHAQDTTGVDDSYDPIVANLDSLVTLNYIQRLNFATGGVDNDFKPLDIPSYSDEVYRARMAQIQSPIILSYNPQVREYIDLYSIHRRQLAARVMGLSQYYFPMFEEALDRNGLPLELKYLAIVESALNPTAVSRMGATGIWQFMLATGKMYGLKVNSYIDERRDPVKATNAACEYFKNMYAIYKDWLLVIAAYNCGPGNVNKAIVRSGGKTNFWEISAYLPKETRGYVPAFVAVTYLMNYTAEHNLVPVPPVLSYYEADTVYVDQKVALKDIAAAIDVPVEMIQYLNPIYKRQIIPDGEDSYVLRLPANKITAYLNVCDKIFPPGVDNVMLASGDDGSLDPTMFVSRTVKKYHTVKKRETMASIASKYRCSSADIKRWNKMKGTKVYKGQKLMVYATVYQKAATSTQADAKVDSLKTLVPDTSKKIQSSPTGSTTKIIHHVVERGDTLWNIAQRYDLTVQKLKELNNIKNANSIKPGTKLKVVVGS